MDEHDDWVARDAARVWHGFTQMAAYADNRPVVVDHAEGHHVVDVAGRRYLDAISSLWVTTLGHRVPELDDAIREQLDKVAHTTLLGNGNRVVVELCEALAPRVPLSDPHFLFASDGAAAVEQALRIAFQFWTNQGISGRTTYLAFDGAYHGDTIGSLSVGAGGFGTDVYDPLRFPVLRAPGLHGPEGAGPAVELLARHGHKLAAVVVEPIVQGAAGMLVHEPEALAALARACDEHDVLLIVDEVATGFGRTGTLFACEQARVRPDLMCIGKGLTGGYLPMAATVANGRVFEAFLGEDLSERTLYHGHSYSGNALGAAVALRHLHLLDERDVVAGVGPLGDELGGLLAGRVAPLPGVADIRRRGLMTGIELAPPRAGLRWGRRVTAACVDRGVLIRPLGDVIVLMPPLDVTSAELETIVDALAEAIEEVCGPEAAPQGVWGARVAGRLDAIRDAGRWRSVPDLDGAGHHLTLDGHAIVSFASNDYLGLADHPAVVAAVHAAADRWGAGAGAARLIVGARSIHRDLEAALAEWKGTEAAVLFPTGFAANLGVLTTLAGPGTLLCSDALNHASIIDGCRLAGADVAVYPHRDLDVLAARLAATDRPAVVVTDTVFSMDGDVADLDATAELCARHDALLVLDEAHAVLGPRLDPLDHPGLSLVRVGTLSKTLGSLGGFAATSGPIADLLVNEARSFIFTTASPPTVAAAALAALGVVRSSEGEALVARLRHHVERVAPGHPSPIVPVVLGAEERALAASARLRELGYLVPAIRPPTVAPGTARLRVALSAGHTDAEVSGFLAALEAVLSEPRVVDADA